VSETDRNETASINAAPPTEGAVSGYHFLNQLIEQGRSETEIRDALKKAGHDEESVRVLVNSHFGKNYEELPSANVAPGINALSPNLFSISELGLQGKPSVVASYYVMFGVAIAVLVGLFFLMAQLGMTDAPTEFSLDAFKALLLLGAVSFFWGVFKWFNAIDVRRKL
jgi:hypothetical protein